MIQIASYWKGFVQWASVTLSPMSIIYYIPEEDVSDLKARMKSTKLRDNIHIQYVIRENASMYPVNALRNKAIDAVQTSYFYISDMDVWPSRRRIIVFDI